MSAPLTARAWEEARLAAMASIPAEVHAAGLPSVLLPYQARAVNLLDAGCPVLFVEKSRRIGLTWGLAAYAVLRAGRQKSARGMDVMYISFSREMTREFIDACAMWARAFDMAATAAEETLFDGDDTKAINAFRIKFASGFEIMALSSAPRGLRGKQGVVIIDEAAFVDDLGALLKSAMAFTMWGGQVVVCSTHLGADNEFNVQIQDILAGRSNYAHMSITLDQALEQGLYKRIALVTGEVWSPAAEAKWRQGVIDRYRDNIDEECYCVPSMSSGAWLPAPLIEARMTVDTPVLRLELPADYLYRHRLDQMILMAPFMEALKAQLAALDLTPQFAFGSDFARSIDLTTGSLMAIEAQLKRREVLAYELRNVPGDEQKLIAKTILDHVRGRLVGAAFDATGMGWTVAEDMGRLFGLREDPEGSGLIMAVKFTEEWYRLNMPPLKAAFEDDALALIKDADHLSDLRAIKVIRGIARVPPLREGDTGKKRHGDHAIAVALAHWASRQRWVEYGYQAVPRQGVRPAEGGGLGFPDDAQDNWLRTPMGKTFFGRL
jgi:phage FluMu gp28-like protein